jgi:heme/copper-type cytochrome/quinol oxidase subunit 2
MPSKKHTGSIIKYLPVYGCISTGIIYVAVGVIAILSFLKLKHGGADESSLLVFLHRSIVGSILIWIILIGTICYIIWRIYESIKDPYGYGANMKGRLLRLAIALSVIPDLLIAYTAIATLLGSNKTTESGQPIEERKLVSELLGEDWGSTVIVVVGIVVSVTAIVQLVYGISNGYKERLNTQHLNFVMRKVVHGLAWFGYTARGFVLGIIGYYLMKAGVEEDAQFVVNTDKAFDFIGDHVGHVYFILIAAGTICYGLFMFALGITYDADKD